METDKLCKYVIYFVATILFLWSRLTTCSHILQWAQPADATVKEGDTAAFLCSLNFSTPYKMATVTWSDGQTTYYTDVSKGIWIDTDMNISKRLISELVVISASRYSKQFYRCLVMVQFIDGIAALRTSRKGSLNVEYFLTESDLVCSSPNVALSENEPGSVKCESPKTNPPVTLVFSVGNIDAFSMVLSNDFSGLKQSLTGEFIATRRIHNSTLICTARSSAFPGKTVNCSFGPILVSHLPYVEVLPDRHILKPPVISELEAFCLANAYPPVSEYKWTCEPEEYIKNCSSTRQRLNLLLDDSVTPNSSVIILKCAAYSTLGMVENGTEIIIVNGEESESVPTCQQSGEIRGLLPTNEIGISYTRGTSGGVLYCQFVTTSLSINPIQTWFVDGRKIRDEATYVTKGIITKGVWLYTYTFDAGPTLSSRMIFCEVRNSLEVFQATCRVDAQPQIIPEALTEIIYTTQSVSSSNDAMTISCMDINGCVKGIHTSTKTDKSATSRPISNAPSQNKRQFLWMITAAVFIIICICCGFAILLRMVKRAWLRRGIETLSADRENAQVALTTSKSQSYVLEKAELPFKIVKAVEDSDPIYESPGEYIDGPRYQNCPASTEHSCTYEINIYRKDTKGKTDSTISDSSRSYSSSVACDESPCDSDSWGPGTGPEIMNETEHVKEMSFGCNDKHTSSNSIISEIHGINADHSGKGIEHTYFVRKSIKNYVK